MQRELFIVSPFRKGGGEILQSKKSYLHFWAFPMCSLGISPANSHYRNCF